VEALYSSSILLQAMGELQINRDGACRIERRNGADTCGFVRTDRRAIRLRDICRSFLWSAFSDNLQALALPENLDRKLGWCVIKVDALFGLNVDDYTTENS